MIIDISSYLIHMYKVYKVKINYQFNNNYYTFF
jgi:hypothetical protein